jgi:G6PDH family F420-dependent oxidoreductase
MNMAEIGYTLSSEEFPPNDLVRYARLAEEAGFSFAMISDHYHPWVNEQGHSPFVWGVIGGVAQATSRIRLGTGVTCPIIRIHPAIVAQAAATAASMMEGRFFLGVGTGENLNEHVLGDRWPPHDLRLEMLEEAVEVMRMLWTGDTVSYWGDYYVVEDARIFTLPDEPPQVMVAASGENALELAGRIGDGYIGLSPEKEMTEGFRAAGGEGKPCIAQVTVCWAESEKKARETAFRVWPNTGLKGELSQELRTVAHFEQAVKMLTEEDIAKEMTLGPDPQRYIEIVQKYIDAGYTHVYVHQVGDNQEDFIRFFAREVMPQFMD